MGTKMCLLIMMMIFLGGCGDDPSPQHSAQQTADIEDEEDEEL